MIRLRRAARKMLVLALLPTAVMASTVVTSAVITAGTAGAATQTETIVGTASITHKPPRVGTVQLLPHDLSRQ